MRTATIRFALGIALLSGAGRVQHLEVKPTE